jgi:DNA-binding LacI/PurR family transcriptional regulator
MTRRVTIVDVAAHAGVAISSVSSALNDRPGVSEATRKRILNAASELGFVPSIRGRSLSSKRAFSVALVVQRDPDVFESDPFFARFIGGVESVLGSRGYALVLQMGADAEETLERYRRLSADRRVDGVFLSEIEIDDQRIDLLKHLQMPVVGINADREGFPFASVRQDHVAGIQRLIKYLVNLGHTRIAHVSGPSNFIHARQREIAWREALLAAGVEPGPVVVGDFTYEGGWRAAEDLLLGQGLPTAVMCANDLTAVGFMARAIDLGFSVPGDVSVTGYDDIQLGEYVRPTLTTLKTSPRLIGAEAARLLLDQIEGADIADVEVPPVELIVRDSTGAARRR